MDYNDYIELTEISGRLVRDVSMDYKRPLHTQICWDDRLISIKGARGTGKTTLVLQHIKESYAPGDKALYVSMDNLWFETRSFNDVVNFHYQNGGTHIFIDEIHYLKNWQTTIKNIYDNYPEMYIVYTGSSMLKLDTSMGDLSRRQAEYLMPGLSLREYLEFEKIYHIDAISLERLLADHVCVAEEITSKLRVMEHFNAYLRCGYYPFYKEVHQGYEFRIQQVINQVLEGDYPAVEAINYSTVQKTKKMLMILAQSTPQTPNMSKLYEQLETDRNLGLKMLNVLQRANILNLLSSEAASLKNMSRPDKIYCDNTNIMYALTPRADIGSARETFFLNQLRMAGHDVKYPPQGDFIIDGKYLFEVGGKRKNFDQIKDIPDSYLAVDDTEVGRKNRIPLWMFGFLY